MRRTSEEGIELIKRFEGLETQAYRDVAGVWTIGYGHTGPEVGPGQRVSVAGALDLLRRDLKRFEDAVASAVAISLTQGQFDALVSLSYNIGIAAFRRSTALRRLNAGDARGAAEAMTWWNKATVGGRKQVIRGLSRRRAAEAALFLDSALDDGPRLAGTIIEEAPPTLPSKAAMGTLGVGLGALAAICTMGARRGGWHHLRR